MYKRIGLTMISRRSNLQWIISVSLKEENSYQVMGSDLPVSGTTWDKERSCIRWGKGESGLRDILGRDLPTGQSPGESRALVHSQNIEHIPRVLWMVEANWFFAPCHARRPRSLQSKALAVPQSNQCKPYVFCTIVCHWNKSVTSGALVFVMLGLDS